MTPVEQTGSGEPRSDRPRFALGHIYATPGALAACEEAGTPLQRLFARHQRGDWGDLGAEDKAANESALQHEARLLSRYDLSTGEPVWIITEADRSSTTALLPTEY